MFVTGITGAMEGVNPHSAVRTVKTGDDLSFSQVMDVAENKNTAVTDGNVTPRFRPESSKEVMEAWDKALAETGVNPFPMNRISTVYVVLAESGRIRRLGADFLGDNVTSAISMVKRIIHRLENPIAPHQHPEFRNDELTFYNKFLDNLRGR